MQLSQPISFQTEFTIENFFRKLRKDRRLFAGRCKKCGYTMIPPKPVCSSCLSSDLEWTALPEIGVVVSFSEVHVSNEIFQKIVPYVVCIASFGGLKIPGIIKEPTKTVTVGGSVRIEIQPEENPAYIFALS